MSIAPIFTLPAFVSLTVALFLNGFRWDWNALLSASAGGVFAIILWGLNKLWDARQKKRATDEKRVADALDVTFDERKLLLDEYARLRREERLHTESIVAGYSRIAETARKRSHLMAQGFMKYQLAHMRLCELLRQNKIDVPADVELKDATAELLLKLEEVSETELPVAT